MQILLSSNKKIMKEYNNLKFLPLTNEQAIIVNNREDYKIVNTK